jgi:hypothetical protein
MTRLAGTSTQSSHSGDKFSLSTLLNISNLDLKNARHAKLPLRDDEAVDDLRLKKQEDGH